MTPSERRERGEPVEFETRMSDVDALTLGIERDPALRATITIASILDRAPDRERLVQRLELASRIFPRLRQRAVATPFVAAPPRWVTEREVDFHYHLRTVKAPGSGSMRDLLDMAAPFAMQVFDRARPLWEMTIVEGLADGRCALLQKFHHSGTDGIGYVNLAAALLDLERDPPGDPPPLPEAPAADVLPPLALAREALAHERRWGFDMARRSAGALARAVRSPAGAARSAGETLASVGRVLAPPFTAMSPIMKGRSLAVHFDRISAPLDEMKAAAARVDAKLNDAFAAAVTGGLGQYHLDHGADVHALRMAMPISTRQEQGSMEGNHFVPARFAVPLSIADPLERIAVVHHLMGEQRAEPALALTGILAGVFNRLPGGVVTSAFGVVLKGVDFLLSNVPGVPVPLYLAGSKVEANYAYGPLTGAAANITLVSWAGDLHVGINTDPAAVPDPDHLCACLQSGFDEVRKLA